MDRSVGSDAVDHLPPASGIGPGQRWVPAAASEPSAECWAAPEQQSHSVPRMTPDGWQTTQAMSLYVVTPRAAVASHRLPTRPGGGQPDQVLIRNPGVTAEIGGEMASRSCT